MRTPVAVHLLPLGEGRRNRARPRPQESFPSPPGRGWLAAGAFTSRGETGEGSLPRLLRRHPHCLHHCAHELVRVLLPPSHSESATIECPAEGRADQFPTGRKFTREMPNILATIGHCVGAWLSSGRCIARILFGDLPLRKNTHTNGLDENPVRKGGRERSPLACRWLVGWNDRSRVVGQESVPAPPLTTKTGPRSDGGDSPCLCSKREGRMQTAQGYQK